MMHAIGCALQLGGGVRAAGTRDGCVDAMAIDAIGRCGRTIERGGRRRLGKGAF